MSITTRDTLDRALPTDDEGKRIEPNPHFDDWDVTPHAYFHVGASKVMLADVVFGGTHQVEGIGRAEQRGAEAFRFDLQFVVSASIQPTARAIVPTDQTLEVKRYFPGGPKLAWTKCHDGDVQHANGQVEHATYPAGLVPDYGSDTSRCGCGGPEVPGILLTDEPNADGFEYASTMCDACVDSWELDHEVVRHLA